MSSNKKIEHSISKTSLPKKLNRTNKTPVYADELAEVKINAYTSRLTFGTISPESDSLSATHTIINESITVVLPTANFIAAISQMIVPIVENEQLLEVLAEDYTNLAEYAKAQLQQLRSSKK